MKRMEEWEKMDIRSASFRTKPFSFSISPELDHLSKEVGLNDTKDFNDFLAKSSGLNQEEFEKRVKSFILKLANIEGRMLSKEYRKYRAEKIKEVHPKEEVRKRMEEYLKKEEYNG